MNDIVNNYNWDFDIYYSSNYKNKLLLVRKKPNGILDKSLIMVNIDNYKFKNCDIELSQDMDKLNNLNINSYDINNLSNIKI